MKYLSQEIIFAVLYAVYGTVVLLSAMVGSGKTTLVIEHLLPRIRMSGKKLLLVVNRVSLRGQLVKTICEQLGILLEDIPIADNGYVALGPIVIMSYQYLARRFSGLCTEKMKVGPYGADEYAVVVFDEIHQLLADAFMSPEAYTLVNIPKVFKCTRIYISATMTPLRSELFELEQIRDLWEENGVTNSRDAYLKGLPDCRYVQSSLASMLSVSGLWKRDVLELAGDTPDYSHLKPRIIDEDADIAQDVLKLKLTGTLRKALVFVSSKDEGQRLEKELNSSGCKAAFICSKSDASRMSSMSEAVLTQIEEHGRFDSVDVVVVTTTLYNGISIVDPDVTHIYIEGTDFVSAVQEAGRVRVPEEGRTITMTIQRHGLQFFQQRLWRHKQKRTILNKFKCESDLGKFDLFYSGEGEAIKEMIFYDERRRQFHYSPFIDDAFDYYINDLEDTIAHLKNDPDGYVKKALDWFNKTYDEAADVEAQAREEARLEMVEYLSSLCGKPAMNEEEYRIFAKKIVEISAREGVNIHPPRKDREIPAIDRIKNRISDHGFRFMGTRNQWTIERRCE